VFHSSAEECFECVPEFGFILNQSAARGGESHFLGGVWLLGPHEKILSTCTQILICSKGNVSLQSAEWNSFQVDINGVLLSLCAKERQH